MWSHSLEIFLGDFYCLQLTNTQGKCNAYLLLCRKPNSLQKVKSLILLWRWQTLYTYETLSTTYFKFLQFSVKFGIKVNTLNFSYFRKLLSYTIFCLLLCHRCCLLPKVKCCSLASITSYSVFQPPLSFYFSSTLTSAQLTDAAVFTFWRLFIVIFYFAE